MTERCQRCGNSTPGEIATNGKRWRCLVSVACKARRREADAAALREALREAIRQGMQEGLAPLRDLVTSIEKTMKAAQQTAEKLKARRGNDE